MRISGTARDKTKLHSADRVSEKTVSAPNVAPTNPLKFNGSLLFVTVFGGARPEGFPVTPLKIPVSFRFDANPNKTKA
jgi:hypothetical protein